MQEPLKRRKKRKEKSKESTPLCYQQPRLSKTRLSSPKSTHCVSTRARFTLAARLSPLRAAKNFLKVQLCCRWGGTRESREESTSPEPQAAGKAAFPAPPLLTYEVFVSQVAKFVLLLLPESRGHAARLRAPCSAEEYCFQPSRD